MQNSLFFYLSATLFSFFDYLYSPLRCCIFLADMSFEIVCDILDEALVVENDAWLGNTVLLQLSDESSSCDTIVDGGKIVGAVHLYRLSVIRSPSVRRLSMVNFMPDTCGKSPNSTGVCFVQSSSRSLSCAPVISTIHT